MTAPAQRLREAAARLRETAEKATPGPWTILGESVMGPAAVLVAEVFEYQRPGDLGWIALASPALAEPLAELLLAIAPTLEGVGQPQSRAQRAALAVADAILAGGAS